MFVCMYVCMYVYMYVCMYVCIEEARKEDTESVGSKTSTSSYDNDELIVTIDLNNWKIEKCDICRIKTVCIYTFIYIYYA